MKICRFIGDGRAQTGVIQDDRVFVFEDESRSDVYFEVADVKLLPPVTPSKIVCVGRNYAEHAAELGNEVPKEPLLFLKAPSALIGHQDDIIIPSQSDQVEHEGELAIIIGRECRGVGDDENVNDYIFGFTCLNDVTARDIQRKDVQFTRGKSFDTFCPIGPYIETDLDTADISVTTRVNGVVKQRGRTSQMVFDVPLLVRYISQQMTLSSGDVIATGTPSGVSKMVDGDVCEVEIEGIGTLTNTVRNS